MTCATQAVAPGFYWLYRAEDSVKTVVLIRATGAPLAWYRRNDRGGLEWCVCGARADAAAWLGERLGRTAWALDAAKVPASIQRDVRGKR